MRTQQISKGGGGGGSKKNSILLSGANPESFSGGMKFCIGLIVN